MRISDWSSDVCSSDLSALVRWDGARCDRDRIAACVGEAGYRLIERHDLGETAARLAAATRMLAYRLAIAVFFGMFAMGAAWLLYAAPDLDRASARSEEHTSELQSLMRIPYAVSCLHKKK